MRICSFLPSGTEILCALGLADRLHGVTHECHFYPEARGKTVVVRSRVDTTVMNSEDIDRWVKETSGKGEPLYEIDFDALQRIAPDLILTQDLCNVCAIPANAVQETINRLSPRPKVISLNPHSIEDVLSDIRRVGQAADATEAAERLTGKLQKQIQHIQDTLRTREHHRPRTACLDWLSPAYQSGHWMPEIIRMAGGEDGPIPNLKASMEISLDALRKFDPEKLIFASCGLSIERTGRELRRLKVLDQLKGLTAVRRGEVYIPDATHYFSTSGPNLIDVLAITAEILHPEFFSDIAPQASYIRWVTEASLPH